SSSICSRHAIQWSTHVNKLSSVFSNEPIVFLGPSLSVKEARQILPRAIYFPPVRCGDILRTMRLNPKMIVIIDGFFEHTAAVWHKEILLAIEKGIIVIGASSMGALRAAELYNYGMIGHGKIYEDFKKNILEDDDEVAVMHLSANYHYKAMSDAM